MCTARSSKYAWFNYKSGPGYSCVLCPRTQQAKRKPKTHRVSSRELQDGLRQRHTAREHTGGPVLSLPKQVAKAGALPPGATATPRRECPVPSTWTESPMEMQYDGMTRTHPPACSTHTTRAWLPVAPRRVCATLRCRGAYQLDGIMVLGHNLWAYVYFRVLHNRNPDLLCIDPDQSEKVCPLVHASGRGLPKVWPDATVRTRMLCQH